MIRARFSEPVDVASAENPKAYQIDGQPSVTSVKLSSDGLQASLTLKSELAEGRHELTASGIKDRSPAGNTSTAIKTPVTLAEAVYKHDTFTTDGTKDFSELSNLPASATSRWTMNCFIWSDVMIPDRTLIAGFGKPFGTPGCGRYFAKSSKALRLHTVESWKSEPAAVTTFDVGKWQMLTATCDGDTLRFYKDGQFIGERENDVIDDESVVHLAPAGAVKSAGRFSGTIRSFAIWNDQLSDETIKALTHAMPTAPPVSMAP